MEVAACPRRSGGACRHPPSLAASYGGTRAAALQKSETTGDWYEHDAGLLNFALRAALRVLPRQWIEHALRAAGFSVTFRAGYGRERLKPGQIVVEAKKLR
jgi:hypothetical protein